jgi:MFS family permease
MPSTTLSGSQAGAEHSLGGPMAWWVWSLVVIFVVYLFSFQTGYAIVNSSVQQDIGLTVAQVGTIAAVYTWAFAICQFFGGTLLDRLGSRKVLPISIALVTLGSLQSLRQAWLVRHAEYARQYGGSASTSPAATTWRRQVTPGTRSAVRSCRPSRATGPSFTASSGGTPWIVTMRPASTTSWSGRSARG